MRALILAAGRGSRLGQRGDGLPKCLLEVGRRPMVEHQLETLADAGVAPVGMVVGYCADEIKARVGIRAEFIDNNIWSTTNSLYSFWLARQWATDSLIILNSDTLFHPEILNRLLATQGDAFAFDSGSGHGREHMKVNIKDGRLVDMSKAMTAVDSSGENVGILKLTKDTVQELFAIAQKEIDTGKQNDWLSTAVRAIAKVRSIEAVDIAGLPWGEIDSSYDLEVVRKTVLPAIRQDMRRRASPLRFIPRFAGALAAAMLIYLGYQTWLSAKPATPKIAMAWETADIIGVSDAKITSETRAQKWWVLTKAGRAEAQVSPGEVRVESRLLLAAGPDDHAPYILEITLDGQRVDWFKASGEPSATWKHGRWRIARRDRIKIDVPAGLHTMGVGLIAATGESCLIRIRQVAAVDSDDDDN